MNRDLLLITSGRFVQSFIGVVSMRVMTSILSPAEVGNYFLILSIVGFCVLTLISPFGMYINRKLHKWDAEGNLLSRLATGNLYLTAVSAFSVLVVLALNRGFRVGESIPLAGFMYVAGIYTYVSTANQTVVPALNMLGNRKAFVFFTAATLTLGLTLSVIFSLVFSRTALSWLSGQALSMGAVGLFALVFLSGRVTKGAKEPLSLSRLSMPELAPVLSFAWPLAITYFFMWAQNMSHRLIIERAIGPDFLGLIGVGLGIAAGMAAAVESVTHQLYLPLFYKEISGGGQRERADAWNRMARITLPLYLSFAILVSCTAPFILKLLAGDKFNHAYLFLVCGVWFEFFRMATYILSSVAHSEMRTAHLIKSYLIGAVIVVAGTLYSAGRPAYAVLIPLVLVFSGLTMSCLMYFDMMKLMRLRVFTRELGGSFLLSLPFAAAALFYRFKDNLWVAGGVCAVCGLYFLGVQYALGRRLNSPGTEGQSGGEKPAPGIPTGGSGIILTVAIPTYNGAGTIARTLESVLPQVSPGVEVIICDNCSTDSTGDVVKSLMPMAPALKYFRNDTNVGFDRNVDLAMRRASGNFVWLIGDDDLLLPGGISAVLAAAVAAPDCGVIYADCPHPIKLSSYAGGGCTNGDDFFERTRFKSGFISTNVFNRELWSKVNVSGYFDTGWVHIGFLIEALSLAPSYIVNNLCVDYMRDLTGGMRWGGDGSFIYTGMRLVRIYRRMGSLPYSRRTRRRAYWSIKGAYWRNICIAKAKGFKVNWPVLKEGIYLYKGFASFWLIDLPLFLVPGIFFRFLFKIWKSLLGTSLVKARSGNG